MTRSCSTVAVDRPTRNVSRSSPSPGSFLAMSNPCSRPCWLFTNHSGQLFAPQLHSVARMVKRCITGHRIFGGFAAAEPFKREIEKPRTAVSGAINNMDALFGKIGTDIVGPVRGLQPIVISAGFIFLLEGFLLRGLQASRNLGLRPKHYPDASKIPTKRSKRSQF